ncbi:hypothetical protein HID58_042935 [Brassica napus]|uniref:Uncharacterized protein n=1 Tax=Brassica napus TaxID=3708 RepID=A0ABQ8BF35_BRANA|nr:hypothetical protein HID58_042935 [Brassica napus]
MRMSSESREEDEEREPWKVIGISWPQEKDDDKDQRQRQSKRSGDAIDRRVKSPKVPQELLSVLKEMRRGLVCFRNREHKRDEAKVVERASNCIASPLSSKSSSKNKGEQEFRRFSSC